MLKPMNEKVIKVEYEVKESGNKSIGTFREYEVFGEWLVRVSESINIIKIYEE